MWCGSLVVPCNHPDVFRNCGNAERTRGKPLQNKRPTKPSSISLPSWIRWWLGALLDRFISHGLVLAFCLTPCSTCVMPLKIVFWQPLEGAVATMNHAIYHPLPTMPQVDGADAALGHSMHGPARVWRGSTPLSTIECKNASKH